MVDNVEKVKKIIQQLLDIDIDGETMEHILHKTFMFDQMVKQISRETKKATAKQVWEDAHNNETLTYNTFEEYYEHNLENQ